MKQPAGFACSRLLVLILALTASIAAPAAGYLKIADIEGEATDRGHKDEIEILSWSWGESSSGTTAGGVSGERGHGPITITKQVDKASPKLQEAASDGRVFESVTLYLPSAEDGTAETYLTYKLSKVMVSSYDVHGGRSDDAVPTESITLNYAKIKYDYKKADRADKPDKSKKAEREKH